MNSFVDLFSGIGGFRLAFEQQGFQCVMSSEIDARCRETYALNHGDMPLGDITQIDVTHIPNHSVLTAGFPCQPFSICGLKQGFADVRGTLFFYICEIITAKKPSVVLLENVKFLLHHDGGRTFETILKTLESLGYYVSWSLENAVHFGLPQNRERIFIVASLNKPFDFKQMRRRSSIKSLSEFVDVTLSDEVLEESEYTLIPYPTLQKQSGLMFVGYRNKSIRKAGTLHLSRVHKQPNRIYSIQGTHPTLPSQEVSGRFFIYNEHLGIVRKLTLKECYAIMGFPPDFKLHPSKSDAYKQVGNSVCIPVVAELAYQIKHQLLTDEITHEPARYTLGTPTKQLQLF